MKEYSVIAPMDSGVIRKLATVFEESRNRTLVLADVVRQAVLHGIEEVLLSPEALARHLQELETALGDAMFGHWGCARFDSDDRVVRLKVIANDNAPLLGDLNDAELVALVLDPVAIEELSNAIWNAIKDGDGDAWLRRLDKLSGCSPPQRVASCLESVQTSSRAPRLRRGEWGNLYVHRMLVEIGALDHLVVAPDSKLSAVIAELRARIVRMQSAIRQGPLSTFWMEDAAFHVAMAANSGFEFAAGLIHEAYIAVNGEMLNTWAGNRRAEIVEEHRAIVDALEARDIVRAIDRYMRHLSGDTSNWAPHIGRYLHSRLRSVVHGLSALNSLIKQNRTDLFDKLGQNDWFVFWSINVTPVEIELWPEFERAVTGCVARGARLVYLRPSFDSVRHYRSHGLSVPTTEETDREFQLFRRQIAVAIHEENIDDRVMQFHCDFRVAGEPASGRTQAIYLYADEPLGTLTERKPSGQGRAFPEIEVLEPDPMLYVQWHRFLLEVCSRIKDCPNSLLSSISASLEKARQPESFPSMTAPRDLLAAMSP